MLRAPALLAVLSLALLAGCGESSEEKFRDAYEPVNKELEDLGRQVADALEAAENKSDAELAKQFSGFADEMAAIRDDVEDLDPPDDQEDAVEELRTSVDAVQKALQGIADAGEQSDPAAARTATLELIQEGEKLDDVQKKLAKE